MKPIAMLCNAEQFESIRQILIDNKKEIHEIDNWKDYSYLVNNYMGSDNITNMRECSKTDFEREVHEIWNAETFLQYCNIKTEFVLPKKWYCIVTEENKKMLSEWRLSVATSYLNVNMSAGYLVLSKHAFDKSNYHSSFKDFKKDNDYIDYIEITTEQFKKYVMKEKEINQLPERFAILYCATNPLWKVYITWLNKNYNNDYNGDSKHCYYGYNGNDSFCRRDVNSTKELTILTLEQWDNIINKNQIKQKMNKQKLIVPASDITKLYNVACNTWMVIIAGYLSRADNDKNIIFTPEEIGRMFNEATSAQLPLLEEIFGKQAEIIDFSRLNVGSVVMLEYSNKTFMINSIVNFDKPFTIIMHDTKGRINIDGKYIENVDTNNTYITFVQNTDDKGYFVSCVNKEKDIDFITEVISY